MGNLIQRNRGKRGAPDVTRNLSTGKVTTTYRDTRKKGSLGLRVTKSYDNKGNLHVTESFNYGGGVTKKTRTKRNKSSLFSGSSIVSGRTRRGRSKASSGDAMAQLALMLFAGIALIIGYAIYFAVVYWYISVPLLAIGGYLYLKRSKSIETEAYNLAVEYVNERCADKEVSEEEFERIYEAALNMLKEDRGSV